MEIVSTPVYPNRYEGPAIVLGAATCGADDLARVPYDWPVIAVNTMAQFCQRAFMFVTCEAGVRRHRGLKAGVEAHAYISSQPNPPSAPIWADYIWRGPFISAGTSTLAAVVVARAIGFGPIVICGAPLLPIGYRDGYNQGASEFNKGGRSGLQQSRHDTWRRMKKAGELEGVYSMSGFTRELLGELPA